MSELIGMAIAELVRLIVGAAALVFVGFLFGGVWGALGGVFLVLLFIAWTWKMGDEAAKAERLQRLIERRTFPVYQRASVTSNPA